MEYRIVDRPAFSVVEKVEIHTTENGENVKSIPDFWDRANGDGTVEKLLGLASDNSVVYGVCYDHLKKADKSFEYSIAVESNVSAVPEGFRKNLLPARTWAVFACRGAMPNAIQDTWRKIYAEFFPKSDYRSLRDIELEVYPDGDTASENYYSEIWIPVVKKTET